MLTGGVDTFAGRVLKVKVSALPTYLYSIHSSFSSSFPTLSCDLIPRRPPTSALYSLRPLALVALTPPACPPATHARVLCTTFPVERADGGRAYGVTRSYVPDVACFPTHSRTKAKLLTQFSQGLRFL
jgi:hypothetical protein